MALLALRNQAHGLSFKKLRMSTVYHEISSARYSGPARNCNLERYIQTHSLDHAKLLELGESVLDFKKFEDFLKGLINPRLRTSKKNILGDQKKYSYFFMTHQHVKTIHANLAAQEKSDRTIAGAQGGSSPWVRYGQGIKRGGSNGAKGGRRGGGRGKGRGRDKKNKGGAPGSKTI